jgi:hypothetical protein
MEREEKGRNYLTNLRICIESITSGGMFVLSYRTRERDIAVTEVF